MTDSTSSFHEVRSEQDRLAAREQRAQPLPDQVARLRVEARGGFIHHEHVGVVDERACKRKPPLHSARQFADARVRLAFEPREFEQRRHERLDLMAAHAEVAAEHEQVFAHGEVGVEIVELRHDAHALAREAGARGDRFVDQPDHARIRRRDAEQHPERGGLAGAVRAEESEALARPDEKRQAVDDGLVAVMLYDLGKFDCRRALVGRRDGPGRPGLHFCL
jgi:hypothetical protein